MSHTTCLLNRRVAELGLTLEDLAREMSTRNPLKSLCKLRRGFEEDVFTPALLGLLRCRLGVSPSEWSRAEAEDRRILLRETMDWQRRHFSPHIWIETTPGWRQTPLFAGNLVRKIEAPSQWSGLADDDAITETVGLFVAGLDSGSKPRSILREKITHFLYRHAFELAYRFSPDGTFAGKVEGERLSPMFSFCLR